MKPQQQVCRLSQAKRLKELGIIQKSLFFIDEIGLLFSAFTVAELEIMLPSDKNDLFIACYYRASPNGGTWEAYFKKNVNDNIVSLAEVEDETEAEAMAALLILILEVKEINVDQVNERLVNSNL